MTYYWQRRLGRFVAPLAEVQAQLLPCNVLEEGNWSGLRRPTRPLGQARLRLPLDRVGAQKEDLQGRLATPTARASGSPRRCWCPATHFIRMAKLAEPLMPEAATLTTVSYYGAEEVVEHYNA